MINLDIVMGTPTVFGVWCPKCLLPSAIEVPVNILSERGVTTVGPLRYCEGCRAAP
jgi:hypothetical protein